MLILGNAIILIYTKFMTSEKKYYVYIMTNQSRTLYTGVTNDLERRVLEHKSKMVPGFTKKYNITKLFFLKKALISDQPYCVKNK